MKKDRRNEGSSCFLCALINEGAAPYMGLWSIFG